MPRKLRNPKIRISNEMTQTERDWFLGEGWSMLTEIPEARAAELWAEYSDELLAEYRQKNGLFRRPDYWWNTSAPEQCRQIDEHCIETQKAYFLRHPELQTPEEKQYLKSHTFTRWELMSCSEMAEPQTFIQHKNYRDLLHDDELRALDEHLILTAAGGSSLVQ